MGRDTSQYNAYIYVLIHIHTHTHTTHSHTYTRTHTYIYIYIYTYIYTYTRTVHTHIYRKRPGAWDVTLVNTIGKRLVSVGAPLVPPSIDRHNAKKRGKKTSASAKNKFMLHFMLESKKTLD